MLKTGVVTGQLETKSAFADTDLSNKEYHFVNFDTTDDEVVNLATGATLPPFILQDSALGSASNPLPVSVAINGRTKLKLGAGGATAGKFLVPDSNGAGVVGSAAGHRYGAIALENGVEGDFIGVAAVQGELEASDA